MNIVIDSKHIAADIAVALDAAGREHLVIVAKSTWSIPQAGQRPRPLSPQALAQADLYAGAPGESAMLYGADYARFKPRCDVLFDAHAHAPDGEPVSDMLVAWQVGPLRKGLRVLGPRTWRRKLGLMSLSPPAPFVSQPLHYGLAFGGSRAYRKGRDDVLSESFPDNPAGVGWAGPHTVAQLHETAAPGLEHMDDPIRSPTKKHAAIAFSAIGRHWSPRKEFAGTYDDAWKRDVFPLLPADFDERYHQCAPQDQQMDYPQGGEPVVLRNMVKGRPDVRFTLPRLGRTKVRVLRTDYSSEVLDAVADTVYFEPEEGRFSVVWRTSLPIRRRLQEFATVAIGPVDPAWWSSTALGRGGCAGCDDEPAMTEGQA